MITPFVFPPPPNTTYHPFSFGSNLKGSIHQRLLGLFLPEVGRCFWGWNQEKYFLKGQFLMYCELSLFLILWSMNYNHSSFVIVLLGHYKRYNQWGIFCNSNTLFDLYMLWSIFFNCLQVCTLAKTSTIYFASLHAGMYTYTGLHIFLAFPFLPSFT